MARFFPVRSQCQFDTPGERRFAERLEKLLEDDYLCWSNVPVGPKARYPDFVVLHPRRGNRVSIALKYRKINLSPFRDELKPAP